jgi:hypothetical protein
MLSNCFENDLFILLLFVSKRISGIIKVSTTVFFIDGGVSTIIHVTSLFGELFLPLRKAIQEHTKKLNLSIF